MSNSILNSTKKLLGIGADQTDFDLDVITHINTVFSILTDLGVGPENGFFIVDNTQTWNDYGIEDSVILNRVKTYMYVKVRLYFDPPTNSSLLEAMKQHAAELEWRLNVRAESIEDKKESKV